MQTYQKNPKKHKYDFIIANSDVIISNFVDYTELATLCKVYSVPYFRTPHLQVKNY